MRVGSSASGSLGSVTIDGMVEDVRAWTGACRMLLDHLQLHVQQPSVNISAKLIASIKVLQYSAQELEEAIARERAENPALEVEEILQCQRCGTTLRLGLCPRCEQSDHDIGDGRAEVAGWEEYSD